MGLPLVISPALAEGAAELAAIHATGFDRPWSAASLAQALAEPHSIGLLASRAAAGLGFILVRTLAGEAEVLTLAVDRSVRRTGVGRALLDEATRVAALRGAQVVWLEVAEDNAAALALYTAAGFQAAGRRRGYYARRDGAMDAVMMRRRLNSAPA